MVLKLENIATGAVGKDRFDRYLTEGQPYTVKRLPSIGQLDTEKLVY